MWARLGIVATGLWLIGGTAYFHVTTMDQRYDFSMKLEKLCLDGYDRLERQYPSMDYSKEQGNCVTDAEQYLRSETPASEVLKQSFFGTAIIGAIAWVLIGIAIALTRWVLRGRQTQGGSRGT